jgi:hypothetical protein
LSKQEFLNFAEISKTIHFKDVLDWLNISYQKKNQELRGEVQRVRPLEAGDGAGQRGALQGHLPQPLPHRPRRR